MAFYPAGTRVRGEFLDIDGRVVHTYEYVCFGAFWSSYTQDIREKATLIRFWFRHNNNTKYLKYYIDQIKKMGFEQNVKFIIEPTCITMSLNPRLVSAQEMFYVGSVLRFGCSSPDVLRSFYDIHRSTGYDAGKLILLNHFIYSSEKNSAPNLYNDYTLTGSPCACRIKIGIDEMLKRIRNYNFPLLINSTSYAYPDGFHNTIRTNGLAVPYGTPNRFLFTDVSQFKEFICHD